MNSIKICLEKADEDLFMKSKWWGNPDLPEGFDVPDDLTFICQVRCDEIANYDEENLLPHKGMLYFFAAIDYYFGNFDSYCPNDLICIGTMKMLRHFMWKILKIRHLSKLFL